MKKIIIFVVLVNFFVFKLLSQDTIVLQKKDIVDFRKHLIILRGQLDGWQEMTCDKILDTIKYNYIKVLRNNGKLYLEGLISSSSFQDTIKYYYRNGNIKKYEIYYFSNIDHGCLKIDGKILFCGDGSIEYGAWCYFNRKGKCYKQIEYRYKIIDSSKYIFQKIKRIINNKGKIKRERTLISYENEIGDC